MRSAKAQSILDKVLSMPTPYDIEWEGIKVSVHKNVYPTGELSTYVVDCLRRKDIGIQPGEIVLDYGAGTGFLAIAAAKLGARSVVAVDINPDAVTCAKENVLRHNLESTIDVRLSDTFDSIKPDEKFSMILAGMPFEAADTETFLERSVYDPGFRMRLTLFDRAHQLAPEGRIFTTYSERVQKIRPIESFDTRLQYSKVKEGVINGELNFVYMITPKEKN